MEHTIEALIKGDPEVAQNYARGAKRWVVILRINPSGFPLAERLSIEQAWFEINCGGRRLGQEVMAVTGIAHLYSAADGFGDNQETAQRVSAAIQASTCSVEVKELARRAASDLPRRGVGRVLGSPMVGQSVDEVRRLRAVLSDGASGNPARASAPV